MITRCLCGRWYVLRRSLKRHVDNCPRIADPRAGEFGDAMAISMRAAGFSIVSRYGGERETRDALNRIDGGRP